MRDSVFLIRTHLCKTLAAICGNKDRVIAETLCSMTFKGYASLSGAGKGIFPVTILEGYDGGETCRPVGTTPEPFKQKVHIGVRIACTAGIACRIDSRLSAKGIDHQTRVIGKTRISISLRDPTGFLESILLKRGTGFRYIIMTTYVGKTFYDKAVACDTPYLLKFVGVVRGKHYFFHLIFRQVAVQITRLI